MTSKLPVIFYTLMALLFATLGIALLIAPQTLPAPFSIPSGSNNVWLHQAGLGLLLAATLNLICAASSALRQTLHWALFVYAAGVAATFGTFSVATLWLWLPAALYVLMLLPGLVRRLPMPVRRNTQGVLEGEIKWFNPGKGFGFIILPNKQEYFVHHTTLQNRDRNSIKDGDRVRFSLRTTKRGDQACDVYVQ